MNLDALAKLAEYDAAKDGKYQWRAAVIFATEQKPWGETTPIFRDPRVELVHVKILKGGYSSLHRHVRKRNLFSVVSGVLHVEVGRLDTRVNFHVVCAGMPLEVAAGVWHRFRAQTDVIGYELYLSDDGSPPSPDDIERVDSNGISC